MSNHQPHVSGNPEAAAPQPIAAEREQREKPRFRGPFKQERRRVYEWRKQRPFWAGFFTLLGSVPILYFPYSTLKLGNVSITMSTMAGAASAIIGCLLVLLAMVMWFQPQLRMFAGVAALICGFVSFVTSNLGGFFMGLICVVIGGTLSVAWQFDAEDEDGGDPAEPGDGTGSGDPKTAEDPYDGPDVFVPPPAPTRAPEIPGQTAGDTTLVQPAVEPPPPPRTAPYEAAPRSFEAVEGGVGLGEPSAGSATSRPGGNSHALDGASRSMSGAAKFTALTAFPAMALVAALLPLGPSDPLPPNPFADGPCVSGAPTAPSTASPGASSSSAAPTSPTPTPTAPTANGPSAPAGSSAPALAPQSTLQVAPQVAPPAAPATSGAPAAAPTAPAPTTTPPPATTKPGLLDPLLDPLKSLLPTAPPSVPNLLPKAGTTTPAAAPTSAPPAAAPQAAAATPAPTSATATPKPSTATPSGSPATGKSPTGSPSPSSPSPSTSASASPTGTKPPFPCPSAATGKVAAAPGEQLFPDEPWILKTTLLAMAGMDYKGITEVTTGSGAVKRVLKYEVSGGIDIWNLDMVSPTEDGKRIHVFSVDNVKSYMKDGTVTFYTESLKGNLFGLIPIEFTPDSPPPLNVPAAFFTDVTVRQAGQTGATLVIPDMTMREEKA